MAACDALRIVRNGFACVPGLESLPFAATYKSAAAYAFGATSCMAPASMTALSNTDAHFRNNINFTLPLHSFMAPIITPFTNIAWKAFSPLLNVR
jgi:hypothetical protein